MLLLLTLSLLFAPLFVLIVPALLWRAVEEWEALRRKYHWARPPPRHPGVS